MPTALPKEFLPLHYAYAAAVHNLPPSSVSHEIQRYVDRISQACFAETKNSGSDGDTPKKTERVPGRPSAAAQIDALVQKAPQTVGKIARALKLTSGTVMRHLNTSIDSGQMVLNGKKYVWAGGSAGTTKPTTTRVRKSRTAKATDPTLGSRILTFITGHPDCTKREVIEAMKDDRPNHVGIALARLYRSNKISTLAGPYTTTAQERLQAAA